VFLQTQCHTALLYQFKEQWRFIYIINHTFGNFTTIFGSPLKNFDFCRLSCWNRESIYCNVIEPTSSKKLIYSSKKKKTIIISLKLNTSPDKCKKVLERNVKELYRGKKASKYKIWNSYIDQVKHLKKEKSKKDYKAIS
jgi:hypothetical protein